VARVGGMLSSLLLLVGVLDARAQNLVQNPGFDSNLNGWSVGPGTWDGAQGNSAPGSVFLSPTTSSGVFVLTQCIPVASSTAYDVGGSFRFPSSVTTTPAGSVLVYFYTDLGCTNQLPFSDSIQMSGGASPADTWLTASRGLITHPGTVAVKIHLYFFTFAAGTASGWFDDIRFANSPLDYYPLPPCRLVDTRDLGAPPIGGPVLNGQETRSLAVAGNCGIPSYARSISINVTVTQPTAAGNLRLFPDGEAVPTVSSINYMAGQTRANNAVALLNGTGAMAAFVGQASGSTVHLIIDVNGYFR
jgi:hypothetical protein